MFDFCFRLSLTMDCVTFMYCIIGVYNMFTIFTLHMKESIFTNKILDQLDSRKKLLNYLHEKDIPLEIVEERVKYNHELEKLQIELISLQDWLLKNRKRVVVIFEGRDAAGKGGSIRRFRRYLNPRSARVVALSKPTLVEDNQWYFRRHVKELPNMGEIVFFDRSWYNRGVVEPVMGFCTKEEYDLFIRQVSEFEHMLYESGVVIIKFWFSISKQEQLKRFKSRIKNPLKQWKISPVDLQASKLWDNYTYYIREMLAKTHTDFAPWIIVKTDEKRKARLESIRYVLSIFDYKKKHKIEPMLHPDPDILFRYYRSISEQL